MWSVTFYYVWVFLCGFPLIFLWVDCIFLSSCSSSLLWIQILGQLSFYFLHSVFFFNFKNYCLFLFLFIVLKYLQFFYFCHTVMQISHNYMYIMFLPSLSHPIPPGHHRAQDWTPCAKQQLLTSCASYTWQGIYVDATFPICPTLSLPDCVLKSILYICVSIPSLQIGSSISWCLLMITFNVV